MTIEEANTAVTVMLEARDDAICEVLYNDGDLDDLREADAAYWHALEIWGRLDDEAKEIKEKSEFIAEAASEIPAN